MKTIRYFAALLMLISGVWHVALYFNAPADWGITALAFGVLYFIIGLLLLRPKMIGLYLGLLPIVAVVAAPFMIGVKNLSLIMSALLLMDLVVFVCCAFLILAGKSKHS
jgi:hypothetical protein